tara:strand:+ start:171 stop:683 length:513 start_codon:yes stop_codon:yes gene_type:complete
MIFLSIGSNLSSNFGNRFDNINLAISYLKHYDIQIIEKSNFYETPSYPDKKNPKFINVVISIKTHLLPVDLMSVLIFIEEKLERKRSKKNDPRTCDIDIIDYNNMVLDFQYNNFDFVVPHKKLIYRNFVLYPLQEISPKWKHPKSKEIINRLIDALPNEDKNSILMVEKN